MSKSKRDWHIFADDIFIAAGKILKYTQNIDFDSFIADEKTVDAVIRNLEVIGEAAKNIPSEIRNQYPGIEWQKMAGLRDILIHEYFGIDNEIIWSVITKHIPLLVDKLPEILNNKQGTE